MGSKFTCDLRWVGLRPSQLGALRLPPKVMQKLSDRDRSRLTSLLALLQSTQSAEVGFARAYRDELLLTQVSGLKCELEALVSSKSDGLSLISTLSDFLERQIIQRKFI
jgi:hypothetical protein